MVTGYDHLLFLVGVLFFLYRLRDVVLYVSLFTIGHSVTLLAGVLGGFHANAFVVDAIIGLSVVYKAFENMGGFRWLLGWQPDTRAAVLIFGLCHGFGLATKLQEFTLPKTGLLANIVSFNVGVEIGQLGFIALILALRRSFEVMQIHWPPWLRRLPGYTVGVLGAFWTVQRVALLFGIAGVQ
jgi:hypothetical protein